MWDVVRIIPHVAEIIIATHMTRDEAIDFYKSQRCETLSGDQETQVRLEIRVSKNDHTPG